MAEPSPLARLVSFGGVLTSVGEVIATLQAEGHPQVLIDRYLQGATR